MSAFLYFSHVRELLELGDGDCALGVRGTKLFEMSSLGMLHSSRSMSQHLLDHSVLPKGKDMAIDPVCTIIEGHK